jgi:transcriptional regulator with XRE-family HTH domain
VIRIRNERLIVAFGERVRTLRQQKGLTIEKLAALADIEYRQLSDVERGKNNPTISTVYAIAKGLDIKFSELMQLEA